MAQKLVLFLVLLAAPLAAQEAPPVLVLPDATVSAMLKEAARVSRYTLTPVRPQVVVMPQSWFVQHRCGGVAEGCLARGVFNPSNPMIVTISAETPELQRATILIHELVHFLQWANGERMIDISCDQRALLEAEAYVAAYRFELQRLPYHHGLDVTRSNCR
jgi:hypothetical protein